VLTVGAADTKNTTSVSDDTIAGFSSRGTSARKVDVVAPGRSIVSLRAPGSMIDTAHPGARIGNRFFRGSGSSQAAAVVSGAIALMLQARPSLTPDAVKNLVKSTARSIGSLTALDKGVGTLNVWDAYQMVIPAVTQTWTKATGTGSLEQARGTVHVVDEKVSLTGEKTILGPFNAPAWAAATAAGKAWVGGDWMGQGMTGAGLVTVSGTSSWAGRAWTGNSWAGRAWTGRSWTGQTWSGLTWVGYTWQ
jgi:serine protease AprX